MRHAAGSGTESGVPRARILVIDRDEELCDLIGNALRGSYAVASAPHGAAALDLVKTHEPALILLDPRVPIMDGWSFVQQYRRIAELPAKIVAMSAAPDLPHLAQQLMADRAGLASGAALYSAARSTSPTWSYTNCSGLIPRRLLTSSRHQSEGMVRPFCQPATVVSETPS